MTKKSRLENMSGKDAVCSRGASPGKPLEQGTNHQAAAMHRASPEVTQIGRHTVDEQKRRS